MPSRRTPTARPKGRSASKSPASSTARTATGKKMNPSLLANAEHRALEGVRERTEAGHRKAGRTPPSVVATRPAAEARDGKRGTSMPRQIDDAIRNPYLVVTE